MSCAGHVLRRFDLSYLTHHRPLVWGDCSIRDNKVAMEKMAIINTFGHVLIDDRCMKIQDTKFYFKLVSKY